MSLVLVSPEVEVYVRQVNMVATTDVYGAFTFENVPSGNYAVVIFGFAYELVEELGFYYQ